MIFDTDIIIWAQRRTLHAIDFLESCYERKVSIVSYMEFIQGAKDKRQQQISKNFFEMFQFESLPLTPAISGRAAILIEQFSKSHGLAIPDALIAATAFEHGLTLATSNTKHYSMIKGLHLKKLRVA